MKMLATQLLTPNQQFLTIFWCIFSILEIVYPPASEASREVANFN
jgi:hypothetical protein